MFNMNRKFKNTSLLVINQEDDALMSRLKWIHADVSAKLQTHQWDLVWPQNSNILICICVRNREKQQRMIRPREAEAGVEGKRSRKQESVAASASTCRGRSAGTALAQTNSWREASCLNMNCCHVTTGSCYPAAGVKNISDDLKSLCADFLFLIVCNQRTLRASAAETGERWA